MFIAIFFAGFFLLSSFSVDWINDTNHDFGEIPYGESVVYEFPFKNRGTEVLVIDNVRSSCGCTATEWSQEAIAPDSTGVIKVDYDAKDIGYFYKKIKVYFKGIRKPEKLTIEGDIVE